VIQACCSVGLRHVRSATSDQGGGHAEATVIVAPQPEPVEDPVRAIEVLPDDDVDPAPFMVTVGEAGQCPDGFGFCLNDAGFDDYKETQDDERLEHKLRAACECSLDDCQSELDGCQQYAVCECESVVEYRTPAWVWIVVGGLIVTTVAAGSAALAFYFK